MVSSIVGTSLPPVGGISGGNAYPSITTETRKVTMDHKQGGGWGSNRDRNDRIQMVSWGKWERQGALSRKGYEVK